MTSPPICISLFSVNDHYPGRPRTVAGLYRELMGQAELAERLGSTPSAPSTTSTNTAGFPTREALPRAASRVADAVG